MGEATVRIAGGAPALLQDPRRGFSSFGHFAHSVIHRAKSDERLRIIAAAPTTVGNEAAGADGGFAVPPEFATEIFLAMLSGDSIIPLCDQQTTSTNGMIYPVDDSAPWGSSGLQAAWQVEGLALSQQKPALKGLDMRLAKLLAFVPLSQELIDDANALASYLPAKTAQVINWRANQAIIAGNGNGQPNGVLNAKSLLVQAKDAGQAASTVSVTNASNMLTRLMPGSHGRAVFLANTTTLGALAAIGATGSGYPMQWGSDYVPGTKIPMIGRLLGRPVIPTTHTATLTSQGDLVLVDFAYYRVLTRPNAIETALSMHVFFDAAAGAFRASFRIDGAPTIPDAISPPTGSVTFSPFIALAAR